MIEARGILLTSYTVLWSGARWQIDYDQGVALTLHMSSSTVSRAESNSYLHFSVDLNRSWELDNPLYGPTKPKISEHPITGLLGWIAENWKHVFF